MRDRILIYAGLVAFLTLITLPAWRGSPPGGPDIQLPAGKKECVEDRAYMRAAHMDLLINWREQAVRAGNRKYKQFEVSLTGTCLQQCHTNKAEFCDRCHNYAAVSQTCWDCHVEPKRAVLRSAR